MLLIFLALTFLSLSSSAIAKDDGCKKEVQALQVVLADQEFQTKAWNLGFSWGATGLGIINLARSKGEEDPAEGDGGLHRKTILKVSGIRGTLGGLSVFLKPLPWKETTRSTSVPSCKLAQELKKNLASNRQTQIDRPYVRIGLVTLGAILIPAYILAI